MPLGTNLAKAYAKADDVERKLFLKDQTLVLAKGNRGEFRLTELISGWSLDEREYFEPPPSGARYYKLYVNDPTGERLQALRDMTVVKIGTQMYSIATKPSFLSAVPSYLFRIKAIGAQI